MNLRNLFANQNRSAKAGRQIMYTFIFQSINVIIGFVYVPLLLNYLTQEKYGIWVTLISIVGWFSFFDIGLGNGLRNRLTKSIALEDKNLSKKYISTTYALLGCIFFAVLIIFNILNKYINWTAIFNTKSIENHELVNLTSVVFSFFIIRFIVQIVGMIYYADQKPSVNYTTLATTNILSLILVYILSKLNQNGNLFLLGLIISFVPVLVYILLSFYTYRKKYPYFRPSFKSIDLKLGKDLMKIGFKFFFMQITSVIIFSTSTIFVAQFFGPEEVVIYNIAFKYFQLPVMGFSIILTPLWSAVTDAYVKADFTWLRITLKRLNIVSIIFVIGIVLMAILSGPFYKIWIGEKLHIPFSLSLIMSLYSIIYVIAAPYSYFINGTGKIRLTTNLSILSIGLYFITVFAFSHFFGNSTGIILSVVITSLIGAIIQPIQTYKILNKNANGIWLKE